jgi:hypothetical protein
VKVLFHENRNKVIEGVLPAIATCQGGVLRSHIESHAPGRLEEITEAAPPACGKHPQHHQDIGARHQVPLIIRNETSYAQLGQGTR